MAFLRTRNNLQKKEWYWRSKTWFENKPAFWFWSKMFRGSYSVKKSRGSFQLLLPSLASFIRAVLYAVVIILIIESYNHFWPISEEWRRVFDSQAVDALLTAIASITGVFLALYFTAISSVAANLLVKASQDIRNFFLLTPTGEQYISTVTTTGIITVFYIVAKSLGHEIHPVGIVFLSLLGAYAILRFWRVGSDVFTSLEPSGSLPSITFDIANNIKAVTPPGFEWNKPSLQNHRRVLTSTSLKLVKNLIDFGINTLELSNDQLKLALSYLGGLMIFYAEEKRKIPTDSYWYETKNQFQDWAFADYSQISIALNTGTPLQPKTVKDVLWFEEQILDISSKILRSFAKPEKEDIISLSTGLDIYVDVAESYAKDFDTKSVEILFKKFEWIRSFKPTKVILNDKNPTHKSHLALVDAEGRAGIAALLGLMKYLDKNSCQNVTEKISKIDWLSNDGIYLVGLPSSVLVRLESISSDLKNEVAIEGKIISTDWYIETLCIQNYLFTLLEYFKFLKSLHKDYYQVQFERLVNENQISIASQFLQRWKEFSSKYSAVVRLLSKHTAECDSFRKVKDLPWTSFNADEENNFAFDREKEVADRMIMLLPYLKKIVKEDDLPDYFGQALTQGFEACYDACADNNLERLKKIAPAVFEASITAHGKLVEKVQNWSLEASKIIYSTEPLENLFEISGYAKLYSELYENPELWNVIKLLWDTYLDNVDAQKAIAFIGAISLFRDSQVTIMPQASLRMSWKMDFENKMRQRGFPIFPDSEAYGRRDERPNHPSPLIRVIARWGGLRIMASVRDIFFVTYLSIHPKTGDTSLPDRHDIKRALEEEQSSDQADESDE